MKTNDINIIDGLLSYFLPMGILDYFEVTGFAEAPSTESDVLYDSVLHIYLDERDNRTPDMMNSISDGFGEESCLSDFPDCDKKTILYFRRRRWTMSDEATQSVDIDSKIYLKHPGTRYSNDFALFLKMEDG